MKKNLIIFLAVVCMAIPAFSNIDTFANQNSKLLVINETVNTFNAG